LCGEGEGDSRCLGLRGIANGLPGEVNVLRFLDPRAMEPEAEERDWFDPHEDDEDVGPSGVFLIAMGSEDGGWENQDVGRGKALARGILKPLAAPSGLAKERVDEGMMGDE
jgi:hypothetical protein